MCLSRLVELFDSELFRAVSGFSGFRGLPLVSTHGVGPELTNYLSMSIVLRTGFITAFIALSASAVVFAQSPPGKKAEPASTTATVTPASATPAYAELILRRTELQSEIEALVLSYTEEYPKLKEMRYTLTLVDRDIARLGKVKPSDTSRLTLALGKLMVRRIELETDLWKLQDTYKDEHPDVKRAKRRVEIYETSINEILN